MAREAVSIVEGRDEVQIVIPRGRRPGALTFVGVFLGGALTWGGTMMIMLRGPRLGLTGALSFVLLPVAAILAYAVLTVLSLRWGKLSIVADAAWLEIRREGVGRGRTLRFPLVQMNDLTLNEERDVESGTRVGELLLVIGKERVHCTSELSGIDILRVKMALQQHLNKVRPRLR